MLDEMPLLIILSESQYKRKFSQWRAEGKLPPKHYKKSEMLAIVQKGKRRKQEENKDSAFQYRGWDVEDRTIERFEKRNKINSSAFSGTKFSPLGMSH